MKDLSLEHNCGNISPTIYTNMLIFGKDTFLVLIARMISTNPISLQNSIFVTSHYSSLLEALSPLGNRFDQGAMRSASYPNSWYEPGYEVAMHFHDENIIH